MLTKGEFAQRNLEGPAKRMLMNLKRTDIAELIDGDHGLYKPNLFIKLKNGLSFGLYYHPFPKLLSIVFYNKFSNVWVLNDKRVSCLLCNKYYRKFLSLGEYKEEDFKETENKEELVEEDTPISVKLTRDEKSQYENVVRGINNCSEKSEETNK